MSRSALVLGTVNSSEVRSGIEHQQLIQHKRAPAQNPKSQIIGGRAVRAAYDNGTTLGQPSLFKEQARTDAL